MKFYFDEQRVLSKFNADFVLKTWTINFEDNSQGVFSKVKTLAFSLIKTEDMD